MKLPNAHLAVVPERKIIGYLLNPTHPAGQSKASFFLGLGFSVVNFREMVETLLEHARVNEVIDSQETRHGVRYAIDGQLKAPDGTILNVRSAWFIDAGGSVPRFVTAHPLPKS